MEGKKVLLLFSGGKDSFISACRLINQGKTVGLISFNNGSVLAEQNLVHGATRLQNRYGQSKVAYAGCYCTYATLMHLSKAWSLTPISDLANRYPHLINAQVTCLNCQTAMWTAAIAYARAKGYDYIASGYRKSNTFCTGVQEYLSAVRRVSGTYGKPILTPVWEDEIWQDKGDYYRSLEMISEFFDPAVLEPKCMLGRPVPTLTPEIRAELTAYFSEVLEGIMHSEVSALAGVFRHISLLPDSMEVIEYPTPTKQDRKSVV